MSKRITAYRIERWSGYELAKCIHDAGEYNIDERIPYVGTAFLVADVQRAVFFVALHGNRLVGVAMLAPLSDEGWWGSYFVSVDLACRSQGIGTALVEAACRFCAENNYKLRLSAYTKEGKKRLRHVYQRLARQLGVHCVDDDEFRRQSEGLPDRIRPPRQRARRPLNS